MNEVYILHVEEDSPRIHPVAFATLKAAQDNCEKWNGQYLSWQVDTVERSGNARWYAENEDGYFPWYTIVLHEVYPSEGDA